MLTCALCCSWDIMLLNKQNAVVVMEIPRHNNNNLYVLHLPGQFQLESILIGARWIRARVNKVRRSLNIKQFALGIPENLEYCLCKLVSFFNFRCIFCWLLVQHNLSTHHTINTHQSSFSQKPVSYVLKFISNIYSSLYMLSILL